MDNARPAVASMLGVLTVVGLAFLWIFVVSLTLVMTLFYLLQSFEPRDGRFVAWVVGLVIWGVLLTLAAAWVMFRTLRSLGEWALRTTESPVPTTVAKIVTAVFVVAAAVPIVYWLGAYWCTLGIAWCGV